MAVSRKVEPRASGRNRIKRVVRESFRMHHPNGADGIDGDPRSLSRDYVILPAPLSALEPNVRLFESLSRHWREIDRKLGEADGKTADKDQKRT